MGKGIWRRFLVKGEYKKHAYASVRILQGYLNSDEARTVRVRLSYGTSFLTIRGPYEDDGLSRFEWNKEISENEARQLIEICEPGVIDKIRHLIMVWEHTYEVDEFFGENLGLVTAEIELKSEDEIFEKPDWLGEEVTGQPKYYNSMLIRKPYSTWR